MTSTSFLLAFVVLFCTLSARVIASFSFVSTPSRFSSCTGVERQRRQQISSIGFCGSWKECGRISLNVRPRQRPNQRASLQELRTAIDDDSSNVGNDNLDLPFQYTLAEQSAMEDLIVSISQETDDEARRNRLKSIFDQELSSAPFLSSSSTLPAGIPTDAKRFAQLWDQVLIVVGDRVKEQANQAALERRRCQEQALLSADDNDDDDEESKDRTEFVIGKSPEEFQLWALIDMMIQSKTLVKRAAGELGSRGTFG